MQKENRVNVVILGGNGYVGTTIIEQWSKQDKNAEFFAISRSGNGKLCNPNVHYLKADVTKLQEVEAILPQKCDYIIDCVGTYSKDAKELDTYNTKPAKVMLQIADKRPVKALGYIGGVMGPKAFVESKAGVIQMLKSSRHKIAYVEPTLIYGNGRSDSMAKMVPMMKFLGLFSKKLKPVEVNHLADQLIYKLIE